MAIYEYSCPNCGHFEVFQRMSEAPLTNCPECEKRGVLVQVKRLISAPAFHLKGSGWYKTDYASSSSSSSTSSNGNSPKQEKKEESKQVSSDNEGSKPKSEASADSDSKSTKQSAKIPVA